MREEQSLDASAFPVDAEELRRIAEELWRAERNVSQILHSSPVGISISEVRTGRIVDMNEEFLRILGYGRAEVIGRTSHELGLWVAPDQRDSIVREFVERGRCLPRPVPMRRKDGRTVTILFSASPLAHGREPHTIAWVMDVTERLLAEQALRVSEEKWRTLVETAPVVIIMIDRDGRVISINRSISGRPTEAYVGKPAFSFLAPDEQARAHAMIDRAFATGQGGAGEFSLVGPGGELFWFDVRLAPLGAGGDRAILIAIDITAQVRAEAERRRMEAEVHQAQRLESLGVLAGGIAHDFNNLLAAILGNAELALAKLPAGSGPRELVEQIHAAGLHAADLTRQMLDYAGRGRFTAERLDLSAVVHEMGQLLATSVPKKIELAFDLKEGLPPTEADVAQVRQVVMNLILNAAEAIGGREGRITVRTAEAPAAGGLAPDIAFGALAPGREAVLLEVEDDGDGVGPEALPRIFDPFFTTKFAGRGLGLAAVLGIMRRHGGVIAVRSRPGAGTTFRAQFPVAPAGAPCPAAPARPGAPGIWRGGGTALLVEDEEAVRHMAARMLEAVGFEVLVARDGREALELAAANGRIRVVVLDLTMPRLDGRETLRELRQLNPALPVIICSGHDLNESGDRSAGLDCAFLHKPYRLRELTEALREALGE